MRCKIHGKKLMSFSHWMRSALCDTGLGMHEAETHHEVDVDLGGVPEVRHELLAAEELAELDSLIVESLDHRSVSVRSRAHARQNLRGTRREHERRAIHDELCQRKYNSGIRVRGEMFLVKLFCKRSVTKGRL